MVRVFECLDFGLWFWVFGAPKIGRIGPMGSYLEGALFAFQDQSPKTKMHNLNYLDKMDF